MADRKVLNKYYPPDYDPASIPRLRQPKQRQIQSRIMMPMSVQCTQCGDFVYKGKKFNARKEHVAGEDYLGIKRWRFYFRCPSCLQEMTFKTDPQHGGYEVEKGARRNVEPWRDQQRERDDERAAREREEQDVMKKLENKSREGRREHELAEVLEELRERNGRGEKLTLDELVDWHVTRKQRREEDEDDRRAKEAFTRRIQHTQMQAGEPQERSNGAAAQESSADGRVLNIDALDFELTDGSAQSTEESNTDAQGAIDDSEHDDTRESEDEQAEDETTQWQRQRRQLRASGLSFGSVGSEEQSKLEAAAHANDKKDAPADRAAMVVVRKRKAAQQLPHHADSDADSRVDRRLRESRPAAAALSSLLSSYGDHSDDDD